jgi:hypothetical protein
VLPGVSREASMAVRPTRLLFSRHAKSRAGVFRGLGEAGWLEVRCVLQRCRLGTGASLGAPSRQMDKNAGQINRIDAECEGYTAHQFAFRGLPASAREVHKLSEFH